MNRIGILKETMRIAQIGYYSVDNLRVKMQLSSDKYSDVLYFSEEAVLSLREEFF